MRDYLKCPIFIYNVKLTNLRNRCRIEYLAKRRGGRWGDIEEYYIIIWNGIRNWYSIMMSRANVCIIFKWQVLGSSNNNYSISKWSRAFGEKKNYWFRYIVAVIMSSGITPRGKAVDDRFNDDTLHATPSIGESKITWSKFLIKTKLSLYLWNSLFSVTN